MNILVAMDNKDIKKKIDEKYKEKVYSHDITFKEDVLDYIKNNPKNYIIVTKLNLNGNIGYKDYIENLYQINKNNKIIVIVDKLKEEDKKFLFSNENFNIIEGNEIDINVIYSQIESKDKIIYKTVYNNGLKNKEKRKIAVFGSSGAGKTFISYFLSKSIAKNTENNIILESFDVINPSLQILSNTTFFNYDIRKYIKDVNKGKNHMQEYITKDNNYSNLSYIHNNVNNDIKYKELENINFSNLITNLSNVFDFVIIDLPTSTLYSKFKEILYLVDEIIFVINPDYISLKQSKKYLEYICNNMGINKDKIRIVINKTTKYSLDKRQIDSILKKNEKNINIKRFNQIEAYINGFIYNIPFNFNYEKKLLNFLNIKYNKKKENKLRKVD